MITIKCLKEIIWLVFISFNYNIINESIIKLSFGWFNYFSLCFSHVNIGKCYREWSSYGTSIYLFVKCLIELNFELNKRLNISFEHNFGSLFSTYILFIMYSIVLWTGTLVNNDSTS